MEQGNILGEEFKQYVFNQIDVRQSIHGAGDQSSLLKRDPKFLNYLNNRNAWVKMASGVSLIDPNPPSSTEPIATPSRAQVITQTTNKLKTGLDRLKSISIDLGDKSSVIAYDKYNSIGLAKNFVLFNTLSNLNFKKGKEEFENYTFRSGIQRSQESWIDVDSSYGFGGTAMGFQPTPGIIDVSIDCVNRGSIRKATVTLKAYNRYQFSIIEMLYLRLGYTMMLEWGWDKYAVKNGNDYDIQDTGNTIIEDLWFRNIGYTQSDMIAAIEIYREDYYGNYDGFFGKVNNFTWNFNPDGSYDITINLITVGDVVESLKVNVDAPIQSSQNITALQEEIGTKTGITEGSIFNAAGGDVLSQYLLSLILNRKDSDIKVLKFSERIRNIKGKLALQSLGTPSIQEQKTPPELDYFITLGDFLEKIEELVIPTQKLSENVKEKVIGIETDRNTNYISCFYNQIPFDPKVCIFSTLFGQSFIDKYPSLNSKFQGLPLRELDSLTYKFMESRKGFVAGKLMNIYMNIDFLLKKINSNLDEKGDLSLYKLVESICSGLNDALGNVNNLEPVIKDDKTLVIIDQNPISNINKFIGQSDENKESTTEVKPLLEVYGYNKGKSNFLKDIKFQTKIDSSLASMISIGATAGGSSTKNYDATAFSKWNVGLKDRFSPPQEEPDTKNLTATGEDLDKFVEEAKIFAESPNNTVDIPYISDGAYFRVKDSKYLEGSLGDKDKGTWFKKQYYKTKEQAIHKYLENVRKNKILKDRKTKNKAELEAIVNGTYAIVLHDIFGRKIEVNYEGEPFNLPTKTSIYRNLFTDEALVKKLKSSFKAYLNFSSNNQFDKNQQASGNMGFIPISFDITLEGLSGIKIYNKLNIDTRFLPPNYGDALDFIITKVNHKISGNNWDTILGTISTSNIKDNVSGETFIVTNPTAVRDEVVVSGQDPAPIINPNRVGNTDPINTPVYRKTKINLRKSNKDEVLKLVKEGRLIEVGDANKDSSFAKGNVKLASVVELDNKYYLEKKAGEKFLEWIKELKKENIPFTISSAIRFGNNTGAGPHSYGIAVDFSNLFQKVGGSQDKTINLKARITYKSYEKIARIGKKYDWYNPWRLSDNLGQEEFWHFEYWGEA